MARPVVLIVDADPRTVRNVTEILVEREAVALVAANGTEALQILAAQPVEALFCDLQLFDRDGMALIVEAQRLRPDLASVLMTDRPSVESAVEALRNGVCDYVFKPVTPHKVLAAWERIMRCRRRVVPHSAPIFRTDSAHLPPSTTENERPESSTEPTHSVTVPLQGDLKEIERNLVRQVVLRFDGNKTAAAKALGMHRKTLYRVLERPAETTTENPAS